MGVDAHSLRLLQHSHRKHGALGRTITLGRQAIHLGPSDAKHWGGSNAGRGSNCEPMLREHFGATTIDSIDNSDYEGASIVADLNHDLPGALLEAYDTVLDFGCLEHIFDVAQSLRNMVSMCKIGGRLLHALPANGFCGHGFYQFSPELFFNCYSSDNGFANTEIYFADLLDEKHWYYVSPPERGERINIRSTHEIYILVTTQRIDIRDFSIQQSDYVHAWANANNDKSIPFHFGPTARLRELISRHNSFARLLRAIDENFRSDISRPLHKHPNLKRLTAG